MSHSSTTLTLGFKIPVIWKRKILNSMRVCAGHLHYSRMQCGLVTRHPANTSAGIDTRVPHKMRPIPSPKGLPVFGTMLSIMAAGGASKLHLYVNSRHKELGPIYREKIGPVSGVFIADANYMRKIFAAEGKYPKHIVPESWLIYNKLYKCERGLLFMDDEEWLKYRKIMNNVMLKVKQDAFYRACDEAAKDLVDHWKTGGPIIKLEKILYEWSLKVIVAVLLGCDNYLLNKRELFSPIEKLANTVHQIFIESAKLSLMPVKLAMKLNLPVWKRFVAAASSAVEEGKNLLEKLLQMEESNPDEKSLLLEMINHGIELEPLKRIATDLILAAGDTTAHSTQWLLSLLSIDCEIQEKIYDQLMSDSEENINNWSLLKGSLKEALRLYPVAPFITRYMPQDTIIDGYEIKAKELVLMSLYSSGRNEKYFPNAESFRPQRWIRQKNYEGILNPNASLPFAMGARSCIGKKLAETQIITAVSKILKNFILTSSQNKMVDIKLHLISVPAEPISVTLEPRTSRP